MLLIAQSVLGLVLILGLCYLLSERRKDVRVGIVVKSLLLQVALALLLLKLPGSQQVFVFLNKAIAVLQAATQAGTEFIFGYLGGGKLPFEETEPGASFVLAFQAMPLVIVVSVLSAMLMYLKILPLIMRGFSFVMEKTLEIGGALGLGISANAFLGMVESPLLIKPYLAKFNRGELFAVMSAGMATIAGTMLVLESSIIKDVVPNAVGHLISCSLITLPAVVYISHLLVPDSSPVTSGNQPVGRGADSLMDAVATSTMNGLQIFLNIIGMIIVIIALVYLVNAALGLAPDVFGAPITLERILGLLMAPLTMMMGVPWHEAIATGQLMGTKVALTEFIAYVRFSEIPVEELSERTRIIMAYALCGFANFVSLGIMVTGLVTMVPERRKEIMELGTKTLVAGTLATCTSATLVGIIY